MMGGGGDGEATWPVSWLVVVLATAGTLWSLLVFTRDLASTSQALGAGTRATENLISTSERALGAGATLPEAEAALARARAEAASLDGSLQGSVATLDRVVGGLERLGRLLGDAEPLVAGVVDATRRTDGAAAGAGVATTRIAGHVRTGHQLVRSLAPALDETVARVTRIERKLRVLRLVPPAPGRPT